MVSYKGVYSDDASVCSCRCCWFSYHDMDLVRIFFLITLNDIEMLKRNCISSSLIRINIILNYSRNSMY